MTPFVADAWLAVAESNTSLHEDVFMKVGASSTVSPNTLHCFAEPDVTLSSHEALGGALEFFLGGAADGTTPFDRDTLAAEVGRHAGWAIAGSPAPVQMEWDVLAPRFALVHYGTNDMGFGATYQSALGLLHTNMNALLDGLLDQGTIPAVFGIVRRGDNVEANRWVTTYNAALRGLAQARQIPFVDLHHAIDPLPGHGLAGDGLHLEAFSGGACVLTEEGLLHGYNVRNLVALELLDRLVAAVVDDESSLDDPDDPALRRTGSGTQADPWQIGALPWTATENTTGAESLVDGYPACDDADESGPEHWYTLSLAEPTALRIVVLDDAGVDVDIHVLDRSAPAQCRARADVGISGTLAAGAYAIVADTWAGGDGPQPGAYSLLIVPCDDGDPGCAAPL
ncbi:MAG: SGNH/GDSL hydrolase family protein [Myxococcota bacterium]